MSHRLWRWCGPFLADARRASTIQDSAPPVASSSSASPVTSDAVRKVTSEHKEVSRINRLLRRLPLGRTTHLLHLNDIPIEEKMQMVQDALLGTSSISPERVNGVDGWPSRSVVVGQQLLNQPTLNHSVLRAHYMSEKSQEVQPQQEPTPSSSSLPSASLTPVPTDEATLVIPHVPAGTALSMGLAVRSIKTQSSQHPSASSPTQEALVLVSYAPPRSESVAQKPQIFVVGIPRALLRDGEGGDAFYSSSPAHGEGPSPVELPEAYRLSRSEVLRCCVVHDHGSQQLLRRRSPLPPENNHSFRTCGFAEDDPWRTVQERLLRWVSLAQMYSFQAAHAHNAAVLAAATSSSSCCDDGSPPMVLLHLLAFSTSEATMTRPLFDRAVLHPTKFVSYAVDLPATNEAVVGDCQHSPATPSMKRLHQARRVRVAAEDETALAQANEMASAGQAEAQVVRWMGLHAKMWKRVSQSGMGAQPTEVLADETREWDRWISARGPDGVKRNFISYSVVEALPIDEKSSAPPCLGQCTPRIHSAMAMEVWQSLYQRPRAAYPLLPTTLDDTMEVRHRILLPFLRRPRGAEGPLLWTLHELEQMTAWRACSHLFEERYGSLLHAVLSPEVVIPIPLATASSISIAAASPFLLPQDSVFVEDVLLPAMIRFSKERYEVRDGVWRPLRHTSTPASTDECESSVTAHHQNLIHTLACVASASVSSPPFLRHSLQTPATTTTPANSNYASHLHARCATVDVAVISITDFFTWAVGVTPPDNQRSLLPTSRLRSYLLSYPEYFDLGEGDTVAFCRPTVADPTSA